MAGQESPTIIGYSVFAAGITSIFLLLYNNLFEPAVVAWIDAFCKLHWHKTYKELLKDIFGHPWGVNAVFVLIIFGLFLWATYTWIPASFFQRPLGIVILIAAIFAFCLLLTKLGLFQALWTRFQTRILAFWTRHKTLILRIMGVVSIVGLLTLAVLFKWQPPPTEPSPECIATDSCGEYVTWEFYSDGTLKITGDGNMDSYKHTGDENRAPWWKDYCDELQRVEIAHEVRTIGSGAFSGCSVLESVSFSNESEMNSIGAYAFYGCVSLTSADIPQGVRRIEQETFADCSQLQSVNLPDGLNAIGYRAFSDCEKLLQIVIPESVQYIGQSAFKNCGLESLEIRIRAVPDGKDWEQKHFIDDFPCLKSEASSLKNTDFPLKLQNGGAYPNDTFPFIGPEAFRDCKSLKTMDCQNSGVLRIGESAFQGCENLSELTLPKSVRRFDPCAFEGCENLKSLTIPGGKEKRPVFNQSAFANCLRLEYAEICGENITFNLYAFSDCENLKEIVFPNMPENESRDWNGKLTIDEKAFSGCRHLSAFPFPFKNCAVGEAAFENCSSLTTVKLSSGMKAIQAKTFSGCDNLKEIELPDTLEAIEDYAFSHCKALEDVPLSKLKNLKSIGKWAFSGCNGLKKVIIPDGVVTLEKDAFARAKGMPRLEISVSSELLKSEQVQLAAPDAKIIPRDGQSREGK